MSEPKNPALWELYSPEVLEIVCNLHSLFDDFQKMSFWLNTPNLNLGNVSPAKLILLGKTDKVSKFVILACEDNESGEI